MRIRATVAAVSGALVLSAFAVPAAQAAGSDAGSYRSDVAKIRAAAHAAASGKATLSGSTVATPADDQPYALNVTFSNIKVNSGKPIVAGASAHVSVPVTYTLTHGTEVDITASDFWTDLYLYKGSSTEPTNMIFDDDLAKCTATSTTVASCKGSLDIYPGEGDLSNTDAGAWKAGAEAIAWNGQDPTSTSIDITKVGYADKDGFASPNVTRLSKLTVNAAPEPVKKGKTITVTGKLTRANWDANNYTGYSTQPVKLQFRKKSSSTYTTVKTIKTSSTGALKTTVKATVDGYFRYSFAGTPTTAPINATGDYVDVK
ncbi:hypothetical protein [Streptomyces sp. NPDC051572]|uniref:hypothetical protein n=1 Tax=unclassified Streptomyces TaxID=2593676 RepID=UPI00344FF8B5|nr:hypothetical protein OG496_26070 [Streptomyces sp. NBC_00988]